MNDVGAFYFNIKKFKIMLIIYKFKAFSFIFDYLVIIYEFITLILRSIFVHNFFYILSLSKSLCKVLLLKGYGDETNFAFNDEI